MILNQMMPFNFYLYASNVRFENSRRGFRGDVGYTPHFGAATNFLDMSLAHDARTQCHKPMHRG